MDHDIHLPDFGQPDFTQPSLRQTADSMIGYALDLRSEFAADPQLPDLTDYDRPNGLDMYSLSSPSNAPFEPDPLLDELRDDKLSDGMTLCHDPLADDPPVPDLQQLQIQPTVVMHDRPGELDASALQQLHLQLLYQQCADVPYDQVFTDQSGANSTLRRHYNLLMDGLDHTKG